MFEAALSIAPRVTGYEPWSQRRTGHVVLDEQ
jgi:hypothetical protein